MANISQINGLLINAATASLATTASFALAVAGGGGGAAFPFTGSALITGSLGVTGSTTLRNGQTTIQGAGATSATTAFLVRNNTPTTLFQIQNHGSSSFNGNLTITGSFNQASASLASGLFSHVQGFANTASGIYSHAEGFNTRATGQYSHAEGNAVATGQYSHAEGTAVAAGQYSHAEGNGASSNGAFSHAEGQQTTSTAESSHAEGQFTITNGNFSHAEGVQTRANGAGSHAEGGWSYYDDGDFIYPGGIADGNASHAEGLSTLASGEGAHAEGYYTTASGNSSHAEGYYTVANGVYQHVQGQFNQSSPAQSAFIIGNGVDASNRSNLVFASGSQFQITGSLRVSGSITGSLLGTASFAISSATASLLTGRLSTYRSFGTGSTVGTGTTSLTATTSFLIPANTFSTGDILRVRYRVRKLTTNGNTTTGIYINTTNDISTATTLGILTANTTLMQMKRDFYILAATGTNTEHVGVGTSLATDDAATGRAASTINWAVDQYMIFGITHTNTNDSGYSTMYYLERV